MNESTILENLEAVNESSEMPKKIIINSDLTATELMRIIEAALFSAGQTLNLDRLMDLFPSDKHPGKDAINEALAALKDQYRENTSLELKEVSSGFRFQVRDEYSSWVAKLFEERPARYSRATLETLALITYRQPITRAEIEEVRGVSVSSQIIKSMIERDWIRVIGHRDVPGKPALFATTKGFLDYFNLKSLTELPALADLRDIDAINAELDLHIPTVPSMPTASTTEDADDDIEFGSMAEDDDEDIETSDVIH
jgi:segregation and condensation protein B